MDEKYFHEPYALVNAQPELTTMPTDARTKVMSPAQIVEYFIAGAKGANKHEPMTTDCRLMIMRNNSLVVTDVDMVSDRAMMARYELANDQVLILKTIGMTSVFEKFVTVYCERSRKVAKILESPLTREIPGVSVREVVIKHFNELVNNWTGGSAEYGMMCAKVFMFLRDPVVKHGSAPGMASISWADYINYAHFNTEDIDELKADLRVYKAMREIAK